MTERKVPRAIFEKMQRELPQRLVAELGRRLDARVPEFARVCFEQGPEEFTRLYHAALDEIAADVERELRAELRAEFERWGVEGSA